MNRIFSIVVQDKTEGELGNECLSIALEVIGSKLGFVGLIGDDWLLHDIAISDMVGVFDVRQDWASPFSGRFCFHSLYGSVINSEKSFFTNYPLSHPNNIGVPHDHPSLISFLGVPLVLDGGIMGLRGCKP